MFSVLAQTKVTEISLGNVTSLAGAFALAINIVLAIGVSLTVIFLILGGIQYMMAKGDVKATDAAKTSLTNAIIGFIIVVGAFTIKNILVSTLGVQGTLNTDVAPIQLTK